MSALIIWGTALLLYAVFRLWYDNWNGPVKPHEVEAFLDSIGDRLEETGNSRSILKTFLEQDDGREFLMLNLVKAEMREVEDPRTGQRVRGTALLKRYSERFMPVLLARGGHPAIVGRKVGGYIDAWNTPADPGWTLFGLMRYRSRRDMMRLALDPNFIAAHPEKILGTPVTFSFPTHRMLSLYLSPRLSVLLLLTLAAALTQLAFGT
ncbi:hypothetical protein [Aquidulcibacter sp.]|uniref:hypothetical protein n=1 Tax=Aquidulcibacter sp. TaxID=2052990 RepID=UPI0025BD4E8C|nr:hypothetical protein [Aquidulcibacter sp.]MCA3693634.1 hypothetical protein [Aquidulcibacter sp.]